MCALYRRAAKRDGNEAAIVDVLRHRGFAVAFVSGKGLPDLVVGKGDRLWWVEVKQPKGRFKPAQNAWRSQWTGPAPITLRTVEEALAFPARPLDSEKG
jgi:hypothetical protein